MAGPVRTESRIFTQDAECYISRANDQSFWFASTVPGIDGNLGDSIVDTIDWTPGPHGSFFPKENEVTRRDVAGAFRLFIGPKDEVTNVPVVSFAFDIPELLQYVPGTPAVIRITFQITALKGKLQPQGSGDDNQFFYVDLSPLFTAVENLAEYAAIRSDLIHRGVVIFRGLTKKLDLRPVLKVQLTTYFVDRALPITAGVSAVVDYFFTSIGSILPASTQEEIEEREFFNRRGYLKFLLNLSQQKCITALGLEEEAKEFVFC